MPFGVAAGVAAVAGVVAQDRAADKAADASQSATNSAIGEQRAARQEYQQNIAPYLGLGSSAVSRLQALNAGDATAFTQDPGYQFAMDQALEAVRNRGAAGGNYGGGGTTSDLLRVATGLAGQQYGDFWNRQFNLAGLGQNAAAGQGSAALSTASNIGNLLQTNATNQGNAAINSANAWSNFGSQVGQLGGYAAGGGFGGFNFGGGSPGGVTTQQFAIPSSGVNVANVPVQGRIYG